MKHLSTIALLLLASLFSLPTMAEYTEPTVHYGRTANNLIEGAKVVREGTHSTVPSYIKFREGQEINFQNIQTWMKSNLSLGDDYGWKLKKVRHDHKLEMNHYRYQQTYKGKVVEAGDYIVHVKDGKVTAVNGNIYNDLNLPNAAALTEADALQKAMDFVGATEYKWQNAKEEAWLKNKENDPNATFKPKGELVYATGDVKTFNPRTYKLTWKFDVYASSELYRAWVYVDAITGDIVWEHNRIHHANAVAHTKYSGIVNMETELFGSDYRMRDQVTGGGVHTFDLNHGTNQNNGVDFLDPNQDNVWDEVFGTGPEFEDEYARDAHYGAVQTYNYFLGEHSWDSYDDNGSTLESYVHYSNNYTNAFWNGSQMTYGDGGGSYTPLTTLDICGHEVTHGVTGNSSALIYSYESGALNESFSDIFGTVIEFAGDTINPDWKIGEDILPAKNGEFRNMQFPLVEGDPECYLGTNWYTGSNDNGGVHTNSGVQNHWFYILTEGKNSVTGIGMDKAADIAFRNNSIYLSQSSQYADARFYSIVSAEDLFGGCSPEVIATTDAWFEVCVGPAFDPGVIADFTSDITTSCTVPATVNFTNLSTNTTIYAWDFGDSNTSTQENPSHTYTAPGQYTVKLISDGACGIDSVIYTAYIDITLPTSPTTTDDSNCGPGVVNLSASGNGTLDWYDAQTGGSLVNTGATYNPNLSATTSFWVESVLAGPTTAAGKVNSSGGGGYHGNTSTQYLEFDVSATCTLESAWVDADGAGNRTITLWDGNGNFINDYIINIPDGQNTITLNIPLSPGSYRIGGTQMDLYRNNNGVNYPYNNTVINVTGSSAGGSYYYYLYDWVIKEADCISAREEVVGTINDNPTLNLTSTSTNVCVGDSVTLTANGSNINNYSWSTGATTASITEAPNTTTTYTVTVSNQCSTVVDQVTVDIVTAPTVDAGNDTSVCEGGSITLTANGTGSYSWNTGGTTSSIVVSPTSTTTYSVTVNGTCGTANDDVTVTIDPLPIANFTQSNNGLSVDFVSTATNATAWFWDFDDSNTSAQQNPTHVYGSAGNYNVMHVAINQCGNDTAYTEVGAYPLSVAQINNVNSFNLYPNPASERLTLEFSSLQSQDINISLMNVIGQVVETEVLSNFVGAYRQNFDVSQLATGIYTVRLETNEGAVNRKIVVN